MAEVIGESLTKRFAGVTALRGVSFEVGAGGVLLVVGPSGAGKSTLLRLVAGLEVPDEGRVRIGGELMSGSGVVVPPHRRGLAFVFQRPTLWPHMSALDNVALALVGRGLPRRERRRRAAAALEQLHLAARLRAYPATLSGGELQRVGLARALVVGPRVLLLDEPFASLDAGLRQELVRELGSLSAPREGAKTPGMTILWASQHHEEALPLATRVLLLRRGAAKEWGEPEAVVSRPRTAFGARFLADANLVPGRLIRPGLARSALGEVECEGGSGRPGEPVLLAVPPQGFVVSSNGALQVRVLGSEFRGSHFAHQVRIEDVTLRVHLPERLAEGEVVSLRLTRTPVVVKDE